MSQYKSFTHVILDTLVERRQEVEKTTKKPESEDEDLKDIGKSKKATQVDITPDLDKTSFTEETEQLDEISKKSLKDYVSASKEDRDDLRSRRRDPDYYHVGRAGIGYDHESKQNDDRALKNRSKGVRLAKEKMKKRGGEAKIKATNEEQLDELSRNTLSNYTVKALYDDKKKRTKGAWKAQTRLMGKMKTKDGKMKKYRTEETEQLDEISKKTLKNYVKKATDDSKKQTDTLGQNPDDQTANRKHMNRWSGRDNAKARLKGKFGLGYGKKGSKTYTAEEVEINESDEWHFSKGGGSEGARIIPVKVSKEKHAKHGLDKLEKTGDGRYSDTWTVKHKPTGHTHSIYHNRGEWRIRPHTGGDPKVTHKLKKYLEEGVEQIDEAPKRRDPSIDQVATSPAGWRSPEGLGSDDKREIRKHQHDLQVNAYKRQSKEFKKKHGNIAEGTEMQENLFTDEELQRLDELSKKTLGNYVKSVSQEREYGAASYMAKGGQFGGQLTPNQTSNYKRKMDNHRQGTERAVDRLEGKMRYKVRQQGQMKVTDTKKYTAEETEENKPLTSPGVDTSEKEVKFQVQDTYGKWF